MDTTINIRCSPVDIVHRNHVVSMYEAIQNDSYMGVIFSNITLNGQSLWNLIESTFKMTVDIASKTNCNPVGILHRNPVVSMYRVIQKH